MRMDREWGEKENDNAHKVMGYTIPGAFKAGKIFFFKGSKRVEDK